MTDHIKFKYDIQNGTIEYEGVHGLLKPTLKALAKTFDGSKSAPAQPQNKKAKPKRSQKTMASDKQETSSGQRKPKKSSSGYKPKFNSELNLLELSKFYDNSILNNNTECVVAFVFFLNNIIKLDVVSGDDIFTCFNELKTKLKMPGAFEDTLKNAKNRDHKINYDSGYANITLTTNGTNLYNHDIIKRKKAEK